MDMSIADQIRLQLERIRADQVTGTRESRSLWWWGVGIAILLTLAGFLLGKFFGSATSITK
jgi:hypothetical protein